MNQTTIKNEFLTATKQFDAYTANGALSHSTTGESLLDYFSKAGTYRDRPVEMVHADVSKMWAESPMVTLQMLFYMRLVTRSTKGFFASEAVQKGQGIRDEYRKAIAWVAKYHPAEFEQNMWLMPVVGCWKDLWHADLIDVLDQDKVFTLIERGMADPYNRALLAKFLPKIRSKSNVSNERHKRMNLFAHGIRVRLNMTEKQYRQFKASGESHKFQRDMSQGLWANLDFKRIPGKALFSLVNHKGRDGKTTLERHALEQRYVAWLETQPVAKFTGYVYELLKATNTGISLAQKNTLDKQFAGLIDLAKKDRGGIKGNVWCALDTSSSMQSESVSGVKAYDVCIGLGIYFSELNDGPFHNHVIMFDNESRDMELKGTFTDKLNQIRAAETAWGSTNFQSVINEIVRIRKTRPDIAIEHYPTTLLVVSDMQFNPVGGNTETNYQHAMKQLKAVGLPEIQIIWWQVNGYFAKDFASKSDDKGVVMISGFDGAVITNILGGETEVKDAVTGEIRKLNPSENMLKALNQVVLTQVKL
jgi:uncharacterized protein DUF2828